MWVVLVVVEAAEGRMGTEKAVDDDDDDDDDDGAGCIAPKGGVATVSVAAPTVVEPLLLLLLPLLLPLLPPVSTGG